MSEENTNIEINRQRWDQCVPIHLRSRMYREYQETLRNGGHCLYQTIIDEVGDVSGKSLLHLQCHIGHDTLSWVRLGARVTGLDFSQPAIKAARELAEELGIDARFVCANVYDTAEVIDKRFDVVFASIGVFCWVPDLPRWMRVAASMLNKGGVLYILDGHPFVDLLDERPDIPEGLGIANNYFDRGPHHYGPSPSYASESSDQSASGGVEWTHTIGDFVSAIADAGLRIQFLHEFSWNFFKRFEGMECDENGQWHLPKNLCGKVPMVLSIRATAGKG